MEPLLKENLMTTKDASELSGYTSDYLARLARSGKISGKRIGHSWLIDKESLARFLDQQGDRKIDYARALARARGAEYRAHRSLLHRATKTLTSPLPVPQFGIAKSSLRSQALAASVALLVIVSGAFAAQAAAGAHLAGKTAALAYEAASGFGAAFGDIPSRIALEIAHADGKMRAQPANIAARNSLLSARIASSQLATFDFSFAPMPPFENTPPRSSATSASMPTVSANNPVLTVETLQSSALAAYALLATPSLAARALAHAYAAIGTDAYAAITASLSAYRASIEWSGTRALALAVLSRDALAASPDFVNRANLAFGTSIIEATHALIRADVAVAYGAAAAAPESARATVALIGGAGDAFAHATARVPALAATLYLRATEEPARIAPALSQAVFNAEYAAATRFVAATGDLSQRYLALVEGTGRLAYASTEGTLALAHATVLALAHAPAALEDAYLGALGKGAFALEAIARAPKAAAVLSAIHAAAPMLAAVQPALSIGERAALATYETIRGFIGSANRTLATLLGPPPSVVMPSGIPKARVVAPSSSARDIRTTVNTYPVYTMNVNGVSEDFVNQSLASLRTNILATVAGQIQPVATQGVINQTTIQQVNMIQDLSNLIVRNGDFRGGTFSGGNLTSGISVAATTGNFTNLIGGATALATTTLTGSFTLTGNQTASGAITGSYFAATTPTATSTFAGGLAVGTNQFLVQQATGNVGIGVLSPTALLAIQNSTSTQPIFTASSAAGSEVYRLTNAGFIGIGTTSPWAQLAVNPNGVTGPAFVVGSSTATNFIVTNGGNVGIGTTSPTATLGIQGSIGVSPTQLYFATNGRVGIGTTSPDAMLSLLQNANGTPFVSAYRITDVAPSGDFINYKTKSGTTLFRVDNSGNLLAGGIINTGSQTITSTSSPQFRVQYDASNEITTSVNSTGTTTLGVNGASPALFFTPQTNLVNSFNFTNALAANSILSIDTLNQRVGIGTTSPYRTLSVQGSGVFTGGDVLASTLNATSTITALATTTAPYFAASTRGFAGAPAYTFSSDLTSGFWSPLANTLALSTAGTERLRIDSSGNVGIGTTSPFATLSVNGSGFFGGNLTIGTGGKIILPDGVVGAPALVFANETNTGLWRPGLNTVSFALNGQNALQFSSSDFSPGSNGGKSLGTSATRFSSLYLTTSLGVTNSGSTAGCIILVGSNDCGGIDNIFAGTKFNGEVGGGTSAQYGLAYSGQVDSPFNGYAATILVKPVLRSSGTNNLDGIYIQTPTLLGTGVVTTAASFHVQGAPSGATNNYSILVDGGASVFNGLVGIGTTTPWAQLSVNPSGVSGPEFAIGSSTKTDFVVTNAGNVGLGTAAPAQKLDVAGNINTSAGSAYMYNGSNVITASTTLNNYFFGVAGNLTMTGTDNTASGYLALANNTTGILNSAFGRWALTTNTTGSSNSALGSWSLLNNTTGGSNVAVGSQVLQNNSTGNTNTAVGIQALFRNTTGSLNTALGGSALANNTAATNDTAVGYGAGSGGATYSNTGSSLLGYQAGLSFLTGSDYNTLLGYDSGYGVSTGANNVLIGASTISASQSQVTTGSQNISIGYNVAVPSATASGQLDIGNFIYGTGLTGTGSTVSNGLLGIGTTSPYRTLSVQGSGVFTGGDVLASTLTATSSISAPALTLSGAAINSLLSTNSAGLIVATSTPTFGNFNATSTVATSTISTGGLAVGGSQFVVQQTSGNVGIGTTTPGSLLTVGGDAQFQRPAGSSLYIQTPSTDVRLIATSVTGAAQNLLLDPGGGNVGIGNTGPLAKLSVTGASSAAGGADQVGIFQITTGTGVNGDNKLIFGVHDSDYSWIQAIKPGTATTNLVLQAQGGNVGIGTTTPQGPLSVANASARLDTYFSAPAANAVALNFQAAGATKFTEYRPANTNDLTFDSNAVANILYLANAGNVGIGTTGPVSRLTVVNGGADTLPVTSGTTPSVSLIARLQSSGSAVLDMGTNGGSGFWLQSTDKNDLSQKYPILLNPNGGNVGIGTTSPYSLLSLANNLNTAANTPLLTIASTTGGTATSTLMTVLASGNVGIGVANPTNKLVVSDTTTGLPVITASGKIGSQTLALSVGGGNNAYLTTVSTTDESLLFQNAGGTTNVKFDKAGNVGIGVTAPTYKLDVTGNGHFTSLVDADHFVATSTTATSTFAGPVTAGIAGYSTGAQVSSPVLGVYGLKTTTANGLFNNQLSIMDGTLGGTAGIGGAVSFDGYSSGGVYATYGAISGYKENSVSTDYAGALTFYSRPAGGSLAERMRITSTGNVGIGTTSPTSYEFIGSRMLDLTGSAITELSLHGGGTAQEIDVATDGAGLYFDVTGHATASNNAIHFRTSSTNSSYNATERMTILSTGNVGIGTTSPAELLHLWGNSAATTNLKIENTGVGQVGIKLLAGTGSTNRATRIDFLNAVSSVTVPRWTLLNDYNQNGTNEFDFVNAANTQVLTILQAGNVGIGTTSPASIASQPSLFAVAGYSNFNNLRLSGLDNTNTIYEPTGTLALTTGGGDLSLGTSASAQNLIVKSSGNVGVGTTTPWAQLSVNPNGIAGPAFAVGSSTATNFVVTNGGNVGIGTTGPGNKLAISGSAGSVGEFIDNTNTAAYSVLRLNSGNADVGVGGALHSMGSAYAGVGSYTPSTTALVGFDSGGLSLTAQNAAGVIKLFTAGSAAANERMRIDATGNVGIGTTSPATNLSVAGNGYFTGGLGVGGVNTTAGSLQVLASAGVITPTANQKYIPDDGVVGGALYTTGGFRFFTNGATEQLRITSAGSVGIGTTNPLSPLQVQGASGNTSGLARFTTSDYVDASTGSGFLVYTGANTGNTYVGLRVGNSGFAGTGNLVLQGTGGNVGIGTTSPNWLLQVAGTRPSFALSDTSAAANLKHWLLSSMGGNLYVGTSIDAYATSSPSALTILNSGNVGIGTTGPVRPLVVNGITDVSKLYTTGNNTYSATDAMAADIVVGSSEGTRHDSSIMFWSSLSASRLFNSNDMFYGSVWGADAITGAAFRLAANTNNSFLNALGGNVGIGTTSPGTLLSIGGNGTGINFIDGTSATSTISGNLYVKGTLRATVSYVGDLIFGNNFRFTEGPLGAPVQTLNLLNQFGSTTVTFADNGNVGIGTTTPNHTLTVAGDIAAIAFVNTSTASAKTDIGYIDASTTDRMFDELVKLKVATYRYKIEDQNDPLRLGFIAEDAQTVAPEILSPDGKGVDLYKLATFTLAGVQTLAARVGAQETRLTSLEDRVAKLESGAVSVASASPISLSTTSLASALNSFGVLIQKGVAQFNTLVFRRLVASKDADGTSSAGSMTVLKGNTVAQVNNSLVAPSTKVFVTFNSQIAGSWWVSDKAAGSFRVVLSAPQAADVSFDYFLVQTEGQIAASSPGGAAASASASLPGGLDTVPPVITLIGDNPVHVSVGGTFTEPGVTVTDNVDGTDPYITFINGVQREVSSTTIDTTSPTTYLITYQATDRAGNMATARRSVIVGNPDGTVTVPAATAPAATSTSTALVPDTVPPVVTLLGAAAMQITVGGTFTDPGATALDNVDGNLTAKIVETGAVNTATAGLYTLTYTATDAAGNVGSASRVVTVMAPTVVATSTTATSTTAAPAPTTVAPTVVATSTALSTK